MARQGCADARQLFCNPQLRGLFGMAPLSTSPKACAAQWSSPPISASTRKIPGSLNARLIVADKGSYVSYLEGCTAPMRDENQLHAAVSNWSRSTMPRSNIRPCKTGIPAMPKGLGGIYNFVTKRALCQGAQLQGQLDAGGNRQRGDLEISQLRLERRKQRRRILFGRGDQQLPAGRHRHQDDPQRQGQPLDHRVQGHQRRA